MTLTTTDPLVLSSQQVTIAIPCFNAASYLPEVIDGLRNLSVAPAAVCLIDDCSTDDSGLLAKEAGLRTIRHEQNRGLGAARQTAVEHCETPWLAMIDSDVKVERHWLSELLERANRELTQGVKLGGVGGDLKESLAQTIPDRWRARFMPQTHGPAPKNGVTLFGCNTLHSVAALRAIGGFNPQFTRAYEDIDISERLLAAGYQLAYEPKAGAVHLRKDSVLSVLKAAYGWRLPRYIQQRIFNSPNTIAAKLIATFREDLRELQLACAEQKGDLSAISFVQLFVNPLLDAALLSSTNASHQDAVTKHALGAEIRREVGSLLTSLEALEPVRAATLKLLQPILDISTEGRDSMPEKVPAVDSAAAPATAGPLTGVIAGWRAALRFPPTQLHLLERSFGLIENVSTR